MIHRDGVFIGQGSLAFAAAGDRVMLGFGADDAVKVTRVAVKKRRENDGGFFGQNRMDVQDFKTTTRNLHSFPVKLTVIDRLPVSENAAIIVEPLPTNTPATDKIVEDKRGVLSWTYELKTVGAARNQTGGGASAGLPIATFCSAGKPGRWRAADRRQAGHACERCTVQST